MTPEATMITRLDGLDLSCLRTRVEAALSALRASDAAPVASTGTTRGTRIGPVTAWRKEDEVGLTARRLGELGELRLSMATPRWWDASDDAIRSSAERMLSDWLSFLSLPVATLSGTLDTRGTPLDDVSRTLGALMSSEGIDPESAASLRMAPRMPYAAILPAHRQASIRVDRHSRTPGTLKPRALSEEAEAAILDSRPAFKLVTTGARTHAIEPAPPIEIVPESSDPMETMRTVTVLGLATGRRHVLKAAAQG